MAAAAEPPPESVPPQRRATGAEIAPLVDGADGAAAAAEPEEDLVGVGWMLRHDML